ncbi:MAG: acyloxyacyl hydrolase [Pseudomonadota bacterium]
MSARAIAMDTLRHCLAGLGLFLLCAGWSTLTRAGDEPLVEDTYNNPLLRSAIVGVLLHDQGPFSDKLESGSLDLNLEVQFHRPRLKWWPWIGAPYPHLGTNLNSGGDTSQLYGGLTWEYQALRRLAGTFSAGMSLHNGDIEQEDDELCDDDGDCGFGTRLIFRFSAGIRFEASKRIGIEAFYDHISHAKILDAENEGIDSVGLRVHYRF